MIIYSKEIPFQEGLKKSVFWQRTVITSDLFDLLGRKVPASELVHKKAYGLSNLRLFISNRTNTGKILFMGR
jgi:hypothetical protein